MSKIVAELPLFVTRRRANAAELNNYERALAHPYAASVKERARKRRHTQQVYTVYDVANG